MQNRTPAQFILAEKEMCFQMSEITGRCKICSKPTLVRSAITRESGRAASSIVLLCLLYLRGEVSQEQGGIMTPLTSPSCVILCLFVSGSWAQLRQRAQGYPDGPAAGGFESPSDDYGDLLHRLENYEKPALPHVAPINDVYNQQYEQYEKYNIEKQDDGEEGSGEEGSGEEEDEDKEVEEDNYYLSIIVPSVAIGLVKLIKMEKITKTYLISVGLGF